MRKGFVPLVIILIIAFLAIAGFAYFRDSQSSITQEPEVIVGEYQKVEIAQLVADPKAWDGKKVEVTGKVINGAPPLPMCIAREKGLTQELKDQYKRYYTNWALSDDDGNIVGVKLPNLSELEDNEEISYRAVVHYAEIPDDCDFNILYKSVYLIGTDPVGSSMKLLPSTAPSNK